MKRRAWWRAIVSGVLVGLAAVALLGSLATRYIQRNVLNTNGYLAIVGPLPDNPQVAAALAKFATGKVFDAANAESAIKEFLPPKLSALAGPLADTLQKKSNQAAQKFIQSDAFSSIWVTANKTMQKGVLRVAESKQGQGKLAAAGKLDLSKLADSVRQRFGGSQAILTQAQKDQAAQIKIDLHQRVERLRTTVRAVKAGAYALPYLAAALLLAAIAVAFNRRRVITGVGVTILLLGVALLLLFKVVSGSWLGDITDPTYKSAAQVVYEAFYGDLRDRIIWAMIIAAIVIIAALIAGPYAWAKWLRRKTGLDRLPRTPPWGWAVAARRAIAKTELWIDLVGLITVVIWLLVLSVLTPATVVVILSLFVAYVSLVHMFARTAPSRSLVS